MQKTMLDKITVVVGWLLWAGFYVLGVAGFFILLDTVSPMSSWHPETWGMGWWLLCIALAIIGSIGYTLFMLMFVYLVRKYIHVGDKKTKVDG